MAELSKIKDEEEDTTDNYNDWQMPLAFSKKRHTESIEGGNTITQTWRMKERVSLLKLNVSLILFV